MVLPHHVIDGRELLSVADQGRREACHAILHAASLPVMERGIGMESAKPARYTGCGKSSGATSVAAPRGAVEATITEPSAIMRVDFLASPQPASLSTRPPRVVRA